MSPGLAVNQYNYSCSLSIRCRVDGPGWPRLELKRYVS